MPSSDAMTLAQIEAVTIADKIVERAKAGVSVQRLIPDNEAIPFIQAYVILRETLAMMAQKAVEDHNRITAGMEY